jgi:multiple sugar transport system permease protein
MSDIPIVQGFATLFSSGPAVFFAVLGTLMGLMAGAIPGLSASATIALMIPLTYYMDPVAALGFIYAISKAASFGGSIPAILFNTPGTPQASATQIEGFPMTQKGQQGKALRTAVTASATGDTFSELCLIFGAVYTLLPVSGVVVAATKSGAELFSTFTFAPGTGLVDNIVELHGHRGGIYWRWLLNSGVYAGVGALQSVLVSASAGYALAKYRFPGRQAIFGLILAGVLVPGVTLAIPQYLLMAEIGLANTYWSVLAPSIISPFGIYLARIYAAAAVSDEMIEAGRIDRASELRIFARIALPIMIPGLVTIFLFQFVAIWNNFLLPFVMLSDDSLFPLTVGLYRLLNQGATQPALYNLTITGSFLAVVPLIALFLTLQRYWRIDLLTGAVKT